MSTTLSTRELEVLGLVAEGLTAKQIGEKLGLTASTVRTYRDYAKTKLGARNAPHAVALAIRAGYPIGGV